MDVDGKVGSKSAPDALLAEARVVQAGTRVRSRRCSQSCPQIATPACPNCSRTLPGCCPRTSSVLWSAKPSAARLARAAGDPGSGGLRQTGQRCGGGLLARTLSTRCRRRGHSRWLVNMHFVRKEEGRYYLYPTDAHYALGGFRRGQSGPRCCRAGLLSVRTAASSGKLFSRSSDPAGTVADTRRPHRAARRVRSPLRRRGLRHRLRGLVQLTDLLLDDGYDHLCRELHQRLVGKLGQPELRRFNLGCLAAAESRLGHYRAAISANELALALSREVGDAASEHDCLYSLGWCHGELGDTTRAVEFSSNALRIAEETGNARAEADDLSILGWYHAKLEKSQKASTTRAGPSRKFAAKTPSRSHSHSPTFQASSSTRAATEKPSRPQPRVSDRRRLP